jgi:hypothetical protein
MSPAAPIASPAGEIAPTDRAPGKVSPSQQLLMLSGRPSSRIPSPSASLPSGFRPGSGSTLERSYSGCAAGQYSSLGSRAFFGSEPTGSNVSWVERKGSHNASMRRRMVWREGGGGLGISQSVSATFVTYTLTWPRSPTSQSFLASPGSSPDRDTDEAADGEGGSCGGQAKHQLPKPGAPHRPACQDGDRRPDAE